MAKKILAGVITHEERAVTKVVTPKFLCEHKIMDI